MNRKENIAPLSSAMRKENSFENLKERTAVTKDASKTFISNQKKQLSLKENKMIHVDKKENNDKKEYIGEKNKNTKETITNQSKIDFKHANKAPTSSLKALKSTSVHIDRPIVFNDTTLDKKQNPTSEERPILLNKSNEHVQIHHKPLKLLQTPGIDNEQKEIDKLENELKEKEQIKEDKLKELSHLQELLKVFKEREEQQSMLEEAEEMITAIYESFDESFNSSLMSYTMRIALKEQQQELLLNELSEINYRLSEQEEEKA